MQVYLPIAEISLSVISLLALGGATGILSGLFGVGGGFLITPVLIFMGVSPAVAVASSANQIVAASLSGFAAHWRRGNVDFKMGTLMLIGGLVGSVFGVMIFAWLKSIGKIDIVISLLYVLMLGSIGSLMMVESLRAISRKRNKKPSPKRRQMRFLHGLPYRMRFPRSKLYISALLPITLGLLAGMLVSIMGIGGGFLLIPAMIYLLGMPTSVVIGTSLFQIMFITANVTILHAVTTQTVDIILAMLLLVGAVIGAQLGTRFGARLPAEQLRGFLALLVIAVALKLAWGLVVTPSTLYNIEVMAQNVL